jgi:hypothetical protein
MKFIEYKYANRMRSDPWNIGGGADPWNIGGGAVKDLSTKTSLRCVLDAAFPATRERMQGLIGVASLHLVYTYLVSIQRAGREHLVAPTRYVLTSIV